MPKVNIKTSKLRFWAKVNKHGPYSKKCRSRCWQWVAGVNGKGYAYFYYNGMTQQAYRVVYEWEVGSIPKSKEIDHLCRNPLCVNPRHLEAVTRRINQIRGMGFPGINHRKTHCPKGHKYSRKNTMLRWFGNRRTRTCRECGRLKRRENYYRDLEVSRRKAREYQRKRRKKCRVTKS